MCGIVGYIGKEKCIPRIISGLESLEYRGYDSAGIAYVKDGNVEIKKEQGRIANLKETIDFEEEAYLGIGHTRWATHGKPCKENSHPHRVGKVTIVHNGIVENYDKLRKELSEYTFNSETDSEVVAAYIDKELKSRSILDILKDLNKTLVGSYALGIIIDSDDNLYCVRKDSPLIIGVSDDGNYIASDVPAILRYTNKYYLLLNDEYACLNKDKVMIYNDGKEVKKELQVFSSSIDSAMKNGYEHFMLKEIYEQPKVLMDTINEFINDKEYLERELKGLEEYDAIDIIGCGSAYHVGLVGKSLIEKYGKIPVYVDIASEYRYTDHFYQKKHLVVLISQSGETADTLAVLRKCKEMGLTTLAIVNVVGSSIAREADKVIYIKAGPEIAVATTKAYSCQLIILSLIAYYLGVKKNILKETDINLYKDLGSKLDKMLESIEDTKEVAEAIYNSDDIFFLGRKIDYSLCLEASLKLKEISYIHSEAYAAGELKHGTISLIDDKTPVISIITDEDIKLKTLSNTKEVCARGAKSIIITSEEVTDKDIYDMLIKVPKNHDLINPLFVIIKCQLISYYVAKLRGCDIDKPRNLAKSVTVE